MRRVTRRDEVKISGRVGAVVVGFAIAECQACLLAGH